MSDALDLAHSAMNDVRNVVNELRIKSSAADEMGLVSLSDCLDKCAYELEVADKKLRESTGIFVSDMMRDAQNGSANLLKLALHFCVGKDQSLDSKD